MFARLAFGLTCLLPLSGCANVGGPWVELNGERFTVEIADTAESQTRGLMFRDRMDAEHGMLFVFDREEPRAFWMRNTRIPLDILYFDAQHALVSVSAGVPPCTTQQCPNYPSAAPAKFTLELNAGTTRRLGTKRGDTITFAPEIVAKYGLDSD